MNILLRVASGLAVLVMFGCGGANPDGPPPPSLEGNWQGVLIKQSLLYRLEMTINEIGQIEELRLSGNAYSTGSTVYAEGDNFDYFLGDGSWGKLLLDKQGQYLALIDNGGSHGILQKDATELPGYQVSDIAGSWAGRSVEFDGELNVTSASTSSTSISGTSIVAKRNEAGSETNGRLLHYARVYGFFTGNLDNGQHFFAWLSADKAFAASWICDAGSANEFEFEDVTGCTFGLWDRQ